MALPTTKSEKVLELSKQVILIYGRAKIGKSTLCSKFPDALFLATEPGLNHLEVYKVNVRKWKEFLVACSDIAKGDHKYKTIVVDTIDNLITACQNYICEENNIEHPSSLPHGRGWSLVTTELNRALVKLANLPYGLIMVSHSELTEVESRTKKYTRFTIPIGGKNRNIILNLADLILFVDSEVKDGEEKRFMRTKPSIYHEAGDRSGLLPPEIPLDFKELAKYFS